MTVSPKHVPPYLKCVATLSCEVQKFENDTKCAEITTKS